MRIRDALLLIGIAFIWGFNFVVIRWGLNHFPPLLFSALRFTLCGLPILFGLARPAVPWRSLLLLGLTLGFMVFGLLYLGIHAGMAAGMASAVMQAQVLFTLALGVVLLGEKPSAAALVAIGIGFVGLALIFGRGSDHVPALGFALVLGGALSWGISNVLIKKLPPVPMLNLMVWISIVPPIPLFILSYLFEGGHLVEHAASGLTAEGWIAVLYTSALSTLLAYGVWGAMLQRYSAAAVSPFALLIPVFGLASAWLFLGEKHTLPDLMGPGLIVTALLINWRAAGRDRRRGHGPDMRERVADA